jgi:uncharacterized protein YggE
MQKFLAVLTLFVGTGFALASVPEGKPSITVTGTGKVVYVPDIGYIHVGVATEGWTAAEAWKKNEAIVQKIFAELRKLSVDEKDLKTDNLSVQPRYHQKPNEAPEFVGYTVSYDLQVTVRKLDQMGTLLDRMVDAGANRNMSVSFGCSKLDELVDQARARAVEEARKKATLYVTGAGARLGNVLAISDTPYYPQARHYSLAEAKGMLPIAAGEQEMTVTITVTWAINNTRLEPLSLAGNAPA